ncbi:hypothetical protein GEMRC1_005237 [Eukaryota sp. GEM-RC1]
MEYYNEISNFKWGMPFLLGNSVSFGVVLPKISRIFEFFFNPEDPCFGSFHYSNPEFNQDLIAYTQIGRYRRVTVSVQGTVSLIIAVPPSCSFDMTVFEDILSVMDFSTGVVDTDSRNFRALAGYSVYTQSDGHVKLLERCKRKDLVPGGNSFLKENVRF